MFLQSCSQALHTQLHESSDLRTTDELTFKFLASENVRESQILSAANLVTWKQIERLTGVKRDIFNQWLQQKKIPSLETILQLCYVCEVAPVQIMNGEITSLIEFFQNGISLRPTVPRRANPKVDPARSLELIHAVLDGREKPLGMRQLCKRSVWAMDIVP